MTCVSCLCQDITNAWKGLERAEKGFEEWLLSELQRWVESLCTCLDNFPAADVASKCSYSTVSNVWRCDFV